MYRKYSFALSGLTTFTHGLAVGCAFAPLRGYAGDLTSLFLSQLNCDSWRDADATSGL